MIKEEKKLDTKKDEVKVAELANNVLIAIAQERQINSDISKCKGTITCNIGSIIQSIIDDTSE